MKKRVSKHWEYNPKFDVEEFDIVKINSNNLINHLLVIKSEDITYDTIMELFGNFNGTNRCNTYDTFDVPPNKFQFENKNGKVVSNTTKFTTTIGIWIFNIALIKGHGFSQIFNGYINENINAKGYKKVDQKLIYALIEDKITEQQYIDFINHVQFFMPFESVLSPNHTEEILKCSRMIEKKKKEFLKEHGEEIKNGNVVVAERMEKELLKYAEELLGDDPGLDVYMSGAASSFGNNFKNMYVMKGPTKNFDPNANQEYNVITSNLIDGVSADEYSLFANSLTAGPYSRGKKTEIGGYWEKLFGAAFQTVLLDEPGSDCGTNKYIEVLLTNDNAKMFMYNYIIKSNGDLEELTSDNLDKYLNKKVKMRFSIFCKSKTGVCNKCGGNFFYRRGGRNIGLATIQIPSTLKLRAMKLFHNSTVTTTIIDPMKAFGLKK